MPRLIHRPGSTRRAICIIATVLAASCGRNEPAPAPVTPAPDVPAPTAEREPPETCAGWALTLAGWDRPLWAQNAALALQPGESLHPGVAANTISGQFTGVIEIPEPGEYAFDVDAEGGSASISIFRADGTMAARGSSSAGAPAEAGSRFDAGAATVIVQFTRENESPFRLRTSWSKSGLGAAGFVCEPIPTRFVRPPEHARAGVLDSRLATQGRVLLGEFGCTRCHTMPHATAVLARAAPNLAQAATRASRSWLEAWIADPQAHKPGSGMPTILAAADRAEARDIALYLASLAPKPDPAIGLQTEPGAIDAGRDAFHRVGCVACHGALEPPTSGPVPFGDLKGKYGPSQAQALAAFLRDPLATHPGGRMPSMALDARQSEDIAAYLISALGTAPASTDEAVDPESAARGASALVARRCVNCHALGHDLEDPEPGPYPKPLAELDPVRGCMDPADTVTPRYRLSDQERRALAAGIAEAKRSIGVPAPIDFAHRTIAAMGCTRCHERAGEGGPHDSLRGYFACDAQAELGDEGRLPPALDGVGGKLRSAWLAEVLTKQGRARPYMSTHMPQFGPGRVGMLPTLLAACDGEWPEAPTSPPPTRQDAMLLSGRRLVGSGGLNCITCHVWGSSPPAGTPGPDLVRMTQRIRGDWWSMYARDPARTKPGTRMTSFFASGASPLKDEFDGDPAAQASAIWEYLSLGAVAPPPTGLPETGSRLSVGDRPIVMRTFLKDAGTRAIAVGFPMGTHIAFDASACRLVSAWRGDFLDASGAWAGRAGNITEGRGRTVWSAPQGPNIEIRDATGAVNADRPHFVGYTLDASGVPTFESTLGAARIRERIEPADAGRRLVRIVEIDGLEPGSTVWLSVGNAAVRTERGTVIAEPGIESVAGFKPEPDLRVIVEHSL